MNWNTIIHLWFRKIKEFFKQLLPRRLFGAAESDEELLRKLLLSANSHTSTRTWRRGMLASFMNQVNNSFRQRFTIHRQQSNSQRNRWITSFAVLIISAILAPLAVFGLWWLGFDPNSSFIQPISWGNPIKVYEHGYSPSYYAIKDVISFTKDFTTTDDYISSLGHAVTDGRVSLGFDIENMSRLSQANMTRMAVEVEHDTISSDIQTIYKPIPPIPPGAGAGGVVYSYQVNISPKAMDANGNKFLLDAKPWVRKDDFDYIALSPGERLKMSLSINIKEPGAYRMVPVAYFEYGDKTYEYRFPPIKIIYPSAYRVIAQAGYKSTTIHERPTIVDSLTGRLTTTVPVREMPQPILFTSNMADSSSAFILDKGNIQMLPGIYDSAVHWSADGSSVIYNTLSDNGMWTQYSLNLTTMQTAEVPEQPRATITNDLENLLTKKYNVKYVFIDYNISKGEWTIADIRLGADQPHKIVILNPKSQTVVELNDSPRCLDYVWSPSGKKIAMNCLVKTPDIRESVTELAVANLEGVVQKITPAPGYYRNPAWSSDEKQIMVGGDAIRIFSLDPLLSPVTIIEAPFTTFGYPQWKPNSSNP
jgi:hypothetical protein